MSDQAQLINGNGAFALDLYHYLKDEKSGSFSYSPYSISLALAMTYAGARGETEQQMATTLHFTLPQDRLHPTFNWLDRQIANRSRNTDNLQINISNGLWGQEGYQFLPEYLDTLAANYGTGLRILDFAKNPEDSRVTINDWVSDQTEDRIQDLIPPNVINKDTRLVLTNAIYFNVEWDKPFEKDRTRPDTFYPLDGGTTNVQMMEQTTTYNYAEGENYQAIELPYAGKTLSMVIFLPTSQKFEEFEDTLDVEQVDAVLGDLVPTHVALKLPKFKLTSDFSLADGLAEMGMPAAFSPSADLSGIDGSQKLFIKDIVHQAFVSVDEKGTEAAAASAVIVEERGIPVDEPASKRVTVDHAFIFLIRDIRTGAVLFIGRVTDIEPN
jgi:serpin B